MVDPSQDQHVLAPSVQPGGTPSHHSVIARRWKPPARAWAGDHGLSRKEVKSAADMLGCAQFRGFAIGPVMGAHHIKVGLRRIGIVLALILSLPTFFGLWTWLTLGHTPPRYAYLFLAAGLGAYVMATSLGWILAGFAGEDDNSQVAVRQTPAPAPTDSNEPAGLGEGADAAG